MKLVRLMAVSASLCAGALGMAACGSSTKAATSSPTTQASSSATTAGAAASGLAEAQARVQAFLAAPSSTLPVSTPVSAPKGVKIAYTWCAAVVCTEIAGGVQQAASAIGGQFIAYHHVDTASTVGAAFNNAIAAHPSMVLTSGDPVQWYQSQLDQLQSDKIPVIAWSIPEPYHAPGIAANIIPNDDYVFNGALEADYVTAESNGTAHILLESIPQYPVLATQSGGFLTELKQVCPHCTVTTVNFSVEQLLSGANVAATVSTLQKNPSTNWLAATYAGLISPQLANAVSSAGFSSLKAVEADGTASNYQMIKDHQLVVADVALPSQYLGWLAVYDGLLALSGKTVPEFPAPPESTIAGHPDVNRSGLPIQILTASTIGDPNAPFDPIPGYQDQFKKLEGLG